MACLQSISYPQRPARGTKRTTKLRLVPRRHFPPLTPLQEPDLHTPCDLGRRASQPVNLGFTCPAGCACLSPSFPSHNIAPMSGEVKAVDMNAALFAAKQQLRSAMKQRLAALPQDAIKEQSTSSSTRPESDIWRHAWDITSAE